MKQVDHIPQLFVFNRTPIRVRSGFWLMVVLLWGLLTWLGSWRWPGQGVVSYLLVGAVGALLAMLADVGHACAHTISARMANAPMDVVLLGADMPRTLYWQNDLPPRVHILRSLGGPVYSAVGLLLGLVWLWVVPEGTAVRYLGEIWTVTNGFIFLSLFAPLPIVDGGVILKWLLVIYGQTEVTADAWVKRLGIGFSVILWIVALTLFISSKWLTGGILLVITLISLLASLGRIQ